MIVSLTDSILVDPHPLLLPFLQIFTIWNKNVTTTLSRECELVFGNTKPEEELEEKVVMCNVFGTSNHLECHHLNHNVGSKHLNVATMLLKDLILEISKRKTKSYVKSLYENTHLPRKRRRDHRIRSRKFYSTDWRKNRKPHEGFQIP